jgi:hypothetical protein
MLILRNKWVLATLNAIIFLGSLTFKTRRCALSPYAHGSLAAHTEKIREKSLFGKKNPRLVALVDFFLSDACNITRLQKDSEFGLQLGLRYEIEKCI